MARVPSPSEPARGEPVDRRDFYCCRADREGSESPFTPHRVAARAWNGARPLPSRGEKTWSPGKRRGPGGDRGPVRIIRTAKAWSPTRRHRRGRGRADSVKTGRQRTAAQVASATRGARRRAESTRRARLERGIGQRLRKAPRRHPDSCSNVGRRRTSSDRRGAEGPAGGRPGPRARLRHIIRGHVRGSVPGHGPDVRGVSGVCESPRSAGLACGTSPD